MSTGLTTPTGIALDVAAGHMYWTDSGTDTVKRADLDGSNVTTLVSGLTNPVDVGLDVARGKLYWLDSGTDKLSRADLDGNNSEDLVTGLSTPRALAVDPIQQKVYWTDSGTDEILRCNLDGSDVEAVVTSGLATPDGLALQLPSRFTSTVFDAINRPTSVLDAYGHLALSEFDRVGNLVTSVDERGFATYFTFDAIDRQTHVKDGVHFAETYMGYDATSNAVLEVDQLGHASYFTFDRLNRQEFVHDRAGALTYLDYDVVGNQIGHTVFLGAGGEQRSTYMSYDPADRQVEVTDALNGVSQTCYDAVGNATLVLDQVGRPTYLTFDKLNRQKTRKNAFGNTWTTSYNSRGAVSSEADPESRTLEFSHDRLGRLTHRNNSLGQATYMGYDPRSNQVLEVNPRGNATYFTFDRLDRVSHREDQLGGVRYFGFDPSSNQVFQLDELNNPTYFTYDGLGRMTHAKDALFNQTYFGFDARGRLVKRVSAASAAGTTYMDYDAASRLASQWFAAPGGADAPIYFSYDQVGNATIVQDGTIASANYFTFDKLDRPLTKSTLGGTVSYEYDGSGLTTLMTDPDSKNNVYRYDAAGRLSKVQIAAGRTAYYDYDDSGLLTKRVFPGGPGAGKLMAYYTWDQAGRQVQIENRGPTYSTIVNYFHYERDANGQVTHTRHEGGAHTYWQYDALDRLTRDLREQPGDTIYDNVYEYDAASNRTKKVDAIPSVENTYYSHDVRNLLETEWNQTTGATSYFSYDDAQRMVSKKASGTAQSTYFSFNQRDMVTGLDFAKSGGADDDPRVLDYTGTGERVRLKVGTGSFTETYLAYDGSKLIREADDGGNTLKSYRQNAWFAFGNLLEIEDGENRAVPAMDWRGTLAEWQRVGGEGGSEEMRSIVYDAFGNEVSTSGFFLTDQRLRFVSPSLVALNTTEQTPLFDSGGLYLPRYAVPLVSANDDQELTRANHARSAEGPPGPKGGWLSVLKRALFGEDPLPVRCICARRPGLCSIVVRKDTSGPEALEAFTLPRQRGRVKFQTSVIVTLNPLAARGNEWAKMPPDPPAVDPHFCHLRQDVYAVSNEAPPATKGWQIGYLSNQRARTLPPFRGIPARIGGKVYFTTVLGDYDSSGGILKKWGKGWQLGWYKGWQFQDSPLHFTEGPLRLFPPSLLVWEWFQATVYVEEAPQVKQHWGYAFRVSPVLRRGRKDVWLNRQRPFFVP